MSQQSSMIDEPDNDELLRRPKGQLLDFPVELRWELTRRHPYYIGLWHEVQRYHRAPPEDSTERRSYGYAAKIILGAVGVFGEPVSPDTPFEQLAGKDVDPTFLCGSLQPITFRAMTATLLGQLSPATRAYLGAILTASADNELDANITEELRRAVSAKIVHELHTIISPELDQVPGSPLFFMHLGASQATIQEDAVRQAKLWKAKKGLTSPKIHTKKVLDYLAVWDRLEGWTGGGYDVRREQKLKDVASATGQSISTVHSHFRSAFHAILGHAFSPALWWRSMGPLKVAQLGGDATSAFRWLARRKMMRLRGSLVSETTLATFQRDGKARNLIESKAASEDDLEVRELAQAIRDLIAAGHDDDRIVEELDLKNPKSCELVRYIRDKEIEF